MTDKISLNENFATAMNYYKRLRDKNNKDIAEALNLPATTVSSWNKGKHLPDMGRLQLLADYLKAPLSQFFQFSLDKNADNELIDLHTQLDKDKDLAIFLKMYVQLSEENKRLISLLAFKLQ